MDIWRYDGKNITIEKGEIACEFAAYLREQGYETMAFGSWGVRDVASARAFQRRSGDGPEVLVKLRQGQAVWVVTCAGLGEWLDFSTRWLFPWVDGNITHVDWSRQGKESVATVVPFAKKA